MGGWANAMFVLTNFEFVWNILGNVLQIAYFTACGRRFKLLGILLSIIHYKGLRSLLNLKRELSEPTKFQFSD